MLVFGEHLVKNQQKQQLGLPKIAKLAATLYAGLCL
jgi:hypothetical protein